MKNNNTFKKFKSLFIFSIAALLFSSSASKAQSTCTADFTWMQPSNNVIAFTSTSTGTGLNTYYYWGFGDGTSGSSQNPTHTYLNPGNYTVCLYISDSLAMCYSSKCYSINVTGNVICILTATAFQLSPASCSTCPTGSAEVYPSNGVGPYTYSWNTSPVQNTYIATSLLPGTYTACITDANGCSACTNVTIYTSSCTANFNWSQTSNNTIAFTNTSSGGTGASYYWSFGDGASSSSLNPVHYYTSPGTYNVCLSLYDSTNCNSSVCYNVSVTGVNCNINLNISETDATCGSCNDGSATVSASGGTPPYVYMWNTGANTSTINGLLPGYYSVCVTDANGCSQCSSITVGPSNLNCQAAFLLYADSLLPHTYWGYNQSIGLTPLSYLWSWGDGTSSNTAYPTHTYAAAGYYTICLTISDTSGCTSTVCDSMYLLRSTNAMVTVNIIPPGTTGIKENHSGKPLTVIPNPAKDYVVIGNVAAKEKLVSAVIVNAEGKIVAEEKLHNNTFNVSKIPAGIYFARLLFPDGHYATTKLVIMR